MSTWPVTLPLPLLSHGGKAPGTLVRSEDDRAAVAQRRRFSRHARLFQVQWRMTDAQWATFRSFYRSDLSNGAGKFTIDLRVGSGVSQSHVVCLKDALYEAAHDDGEWLVSTTLRCEAPVVMDEASLDALITYNDDLDALEAAVDNLHTLVHTTFPALY